MWLYQTNEDNSARYILGQINEERAERFYVLALTQVQLVLNA